MASLKPCKVNESLRGSRHQYKGTAEKALPWNDPPFVPLRPSVWARTFKLRLKACCSYPATGWILVLHFPLVFADNTVFPLCLQSCVLARHAERLALLTSVPPNPRERWAAFVYPSLMFFFPKSCWNNWVIPHAIFDFFPEAEALFLCAEYSMR